ncbi:HupE/UreJ family protein [Alloyangia pacifica]|uniref:HupE/UreJ family protein n=1 Tax=Alloyangia pacifica TaxID=311180 RepID=UPI001CD32265|nr:HupE/UreJ family protein [Alloyangia pacifica]MCA0998460.1 HupE/UreJ family protein [Alloyangia pacifica]
MSIGTAARRGLLAAPLLALPGAASAHNAFGDLGPFYAGLLHPLMAPEQTLLLAALAIFLARQPIANVRIALPVLLLASAAAIILHPLWPGTSLPLRVTALSALLLGALALWGAAMPRALVIVLAAATGALAGLAGDPAGLSRQGLLAGLGGLLGIAAFSLLVWGIADIAQAKLGRVAGAVLASWVVAMSAMAAVLPA